MIHAHLDRDFVGYGANPPDPRWPNGARLALNLVLNYEEGSEPSFPDGHGFSETALTEGGGGGFQGRDLATESMYEFGSRAGVWRLIRLLSERDMTATVFGCAVALERNPAIALAIRELDYDVCCHGWRWERAQDLSEAERTHTPGRGQSIRDHRHRAARLVLSLWAEPQHTTAPGRARRVSL
jgi:allantoinase